MTALPIPLGREDARAITNKIREMVNEIISTTDKVVDLIEQARSGEVWKVLGYESWPAYVTGEFSSALSGLERAERVPIVAKLSETGMSQRAIAAVVDVSVGTVNEHLATGVQDLNTSPPQTYTSGLDNKTYLRNGKPSAAAMTALAQDVPAVRPVRRAPLPDAYSRALYDLEKVVNRLQKLHADDRFPRSRELLKRGRGTVRPTSEVFALLVELENDLDDLGNKCPGCKKRIVPTYETAREMDRLCDDCRGRS